MIMNTYRGGSAKKGDKGGSEFIEKKGLRSIT